MNDDGVKGAWQAQSSQTHLSFDAETVLKEVQRNRQFFDAMILRRDQVEIGVGILLAPTWVVMGWKLALPWTWYLAIPGILWIVGFLAVDRRKHRQQPSGPGDSLRQSVQSSLNEVEHQIRLLRTVLWWYLLPIALPVFAFFTQVGWEMRAAGMWMVAVMACFFAIALVVMGFVYKLNQDAVRNVLEPRRRELQDLLNSLSEESTALT